MRRRHLAVLLTLACVPRLWAAESAAPALPAGVTPGVETAMDLPGIPRPVRLFVPTNHDPARTWPAILFYVGMGADTGTGPLGEYTGGLDYVIAGLPYLNDDPKGPFPADPDTVRLHGQSVRAARTWLARHLAVDDRRVYLAGTSKGGWTASLIGELEADRLAGLILFLAGRQSRDDPAAGLPGLRGKPIYLGVGETDGNLVPCLQAADVYRDAGARVTVEVFAGLGHQMPPAVPAGFRAWLDVQGPLRARPAEEVRSEIDTRIAGELQAVADGPAAERYPRLRALADDPRLNLCTPDLVTRVKRALKEARQGSPAREEWSAERAFLDIAAEQSQARRLPEWEQVRDAWRDLAEEYPQTRYGRLAAEQHKQISQLCRDARKKLERQPSGATPSRQERPRRQPPNPFR